MGIRDREKERSKLRKIALEGVRDEISSPKSNHPLKEHFELPGFFKLKRSRGFML